MDIQEIANSYAEGKANEAITKAIAQAYLDGYKDGYKSGKENTQIECNDDVEFVDLGLPSGTLWSSDFVKDSEGKVRYLPYMEAKGYPLPSIEQWKELGKCCQWIGRYSTNTVDCTGPNGNVISFLLTGYFNTTKKVERRAVYLWLYSKDTDKKNSVCIEYDKDNPGNPFPILENSFVGFKLPIRLVK